MPFVPILAHIGVVLGRILASEFTRLVVVGLLRTQAEKLKVEAAKSEDKKDDDKAAAVDKALDALEILWK